MTRVSYRAPYRTDLVMGGISDIDWWADTRAGLSLSMCITPQGSLISITVYDSDDFALVDRSISGDRIDVGAAMEDDLNLAGVPTEYRLVATAMALTRQHAIASKTARAEDAFAVLNLSKRIKGLGGSGIVSLATSAAILDWFGVEYGFSDLLRIALVSEEILGIGGGWEDPSSAWHGGVTLSSSTPGPDGSVDVKRQSVGASFPDDIGRSLLLVDTGIEASTSEILNSARKHYNKDPNAVIRHSEAIMSEVPGVTDLLKEYDCERFGESLNRQREAWAAITLGISACEKSVWIASKLGNKVCGFREMGAGGGGTLQLVVDPAEYETARHELRLLGIRVIDWQFSEHGLQKEE